MGQSIRCATQADVMTTSAMWRARQIAMAKNIAYARYACGDYIEALLQAEHTTEMAAEYMDEDVQTAMEPSIHCILLYGALRVGQEMRALATKIHCELPGRYPD